MPSVITINGEKLFAQKAQANEQLDIDTFIFANVPGQDPSAEIDREEGIPVEAQQVHTQAVQQIGRINDNVVVYSTVLDSVTGPFDFNWVGLYSSVNDTLVAINHVPTTSKTEAGNGEAGNTLNRNFGVEYSGIADITGITVEPETWQLDFTARLSGMDDLTRNLAMDLNGSDSFIDDGFKVSSRATANTFSVSSGVGYVNGLRIELEDEAVLIASTYPKNIYVDAYFDGNASSVWKPKHTLIITAGELTGYIDELGKQHYLVKIAVVTASDEIEDLRVNFNKSINDLSQAVINSKFNQSSPLGNKLQVFAHRGLGFQFPENTLVACSSSFNLGVDGLEFDVAVSSDGVAYLFHDETVDALTDGTGIFTSLNSAYIDNLKFSSTAGTLLADEKIPRLTDALTLTRRYGAYVMLELKRISGNSDIDLVLADIVAANMEHIVSLQSGSLPNVQYVRSVNSTINIGYITAESGFSTYIDALELLGNATAVVQHDTIFENQGIVKYSRVRGVDLVAYTVNDNIFAKRIQEVGVNKILSDRLTGEI